VYELAYEKGALKGLLNMPEKDRKALRDKLNALKEDPYKASGVKKLKSREGYRIRHRDWRAIYIIKNDQVKIIVIDIGKRDTIYK